MKTVDWYGTVGWLNWPTSDSRWLLGTVVARHMAVVRWLPETLTGQEPPVVGVVRRIDAPSVYDCTRTDPERYPVRALLRLDLEVLAGMRGTLYPEVNFDKPLRDDFVFQNPVIIGITLGTRPAWSNLDPVVRDDSTGLLHT